MPGSKRRTLKKLLSPTSSPSPSLAPAAIETSRSTPNKSPIHASVSPSPLPQPPTHHSPSLPFHIPLPHIPGTSHHHKTGSTPNPIPFTQHHQDDHLHSHHHDHNGRSVSFPTLAELRPSASMSSAPDAGVASERANYMTEEELKQESILEEMDKRERSIGMGHHRVDDGVGKLSVSEGLRGDGVVAGEGGGGGGNLVGSPGSIGPPGLTSTRNGSSNGYGHGDHPVLGEIDGNRQMIWTSTSPPSIPPAGHSVDTVADGYVGGPTAGLLTAEELMFGDGDGAGRGGKGGKKSSKQRFEERQVGR